MDEQLIESVIKQAASGPKVVFRRVVKELRIPPIAFGQVVEQLINSWEKSGHNKERFLI